MSARDNQLFEFEPFVLDARSGILLKDGATVRLTPRALQILLVLVQHAAEVVDKDQLMKEVWPDTFVEEGNLSRNIYELRKALGDDPAKPHYIETIPKRGYRFVAPMKVSMVKATSNVSPAIETSPTIIEKHTFARVVSETIEETHEPGDIAPVSTVAALLPPAVARRKRSIYRTAVVIAIVAGMLLVAAILIFRYVKQVRVARSHVTHAKSTLVRLTNDNAQDTGPS